MVVPGAEADDDGDVAGGGAEVGDADPVGEAERWLEGAEDGDAEAGADAVSEAGGVATTDAATDGDEAGGAARAHDARTTTPASEAHRNAVTCRTA